MKVAKQNRRIREDALLTKDVQNELSIKQKTLSEMMVEVAESISSFEFIPVPLKSGGMNWVCQVFERDFEKTGISKWHPTPEAALEAAQKGEVKITIEELP